MPPEEDHRNLADLNRQLGAKLLDFQPRFRSWAIVAFHYSALHWIDAYLAAVRNEHPQAHARRDTSTATDSFLRRNVWEKYKSLSDQSKWVRYEGYSFDTEELDDAKSDLDSIETLISKELASRVKPGKKKTNKKAKRK